MIIIDLTLYLVGFCFIIFLITASLALSMLSFGFLIRMFTGNDKYLEMFFDAFSSL